MDHLNGLVGLNGLLVPAHATTQALEVDNGLVFQILVPMLDH